MGVFNIKKGKHSSGFHFGLTFSKRVCFEAEFDSSCIYVLKGNDKYDINKLYGLSTSYHHHKNSCRFGWRCINGKDIEILAYTYVNSARMDSEVLGTVKPNEKFYASIRIEKDKYVYNFNNEKIIEVDNTYGRKWWLKYRLYPYFGGNKVSPKDMKIKIKRV
jgi:hypothetical protein